MAPNALPNHLDVHPSVVFQLGETLISDEVQAIVELVKNSYDADAAWSRVIVDTEKITTADTSFFPGCRGQVAVEDDGTGMDAEEIRRGWLTIADSPKRDAKLARRVTAKYRRTPLGDKGLGRLGVQRLGYVVELETTKANIRGAPSGNGRPVMEEAEGVVYHVGIDWRAFSHYDSLSQVPVQIELLQRQDGARGTKVRVSELRDPSAWSKQAVAELQRKLSQMIFPFGTVRPFRIYASVNGEDLDLLEISDRLRDAAQSRFRFSYAGGLLSVDGYYKLEAFRPPNAKDQALYNELLVRDRGRAFYDLLVQDRAAVRRTGFQYFPAGPWFLTTHSQVSLDRLGELHFADGRIADTGPFEGEIDVFDLGREAVSGLGEDVFSGFSETIKQHSGVRVFRDGFAVRPYGIDGYDWLNLGAAWTAGSSFYGLRPRNVIGFVSITAEANGQLTEKTDREGFTDTPYSRNFTRLMREVTDTVNGTLTVLRRRYLSLRDAHDRAAGGVDAATSSDVLFNRIRSASLSAGELRTSVAQFERTVEQTQRAAMAIGALSPDGRDPEVQPLVDELEDLLGTSRRLLGQINEHATRAAALGSHADVLERDLTRLRDQLQQFSELAALGLTAEAVSHEMRTVAGNLAVRTRDIRSHLRSRNIVDAELISYTEHIRSAVSALRKQISHLAPALRYVREHVDSFSVRAFVADLRDFHSPSFARDSIRIVLEEPFDDFNVRLNRGKLTQVLDNLFYNSRYWLRQDLEAHRIDNAEIRIRSANPSLFVWDTGRGIDPAIEDSIFEPFVTNKPKGQGRGLGLFIARQLLQSSGCSIELLEQRNSFNSRFMLEINLAGALYGGG